LAFDELGIFRQDNLVTARALGAVKGGVGGVDEFFIGGAVIRESGDA
jgi:hypothetical protein